MCIRDRADTEWESLFTNVVEKLQDEENINIVDKAFCDLTYDWLYRLWKKEPGSGYRILQAGMKNFDAALTSLKTCLAALWLSLIHICTEYTADTGKAAIHCQQAPGSGLSGEMVLPSG